MVNQKKELKVLGNMIDGNNVFGFLYNVDKGEKNGPKRTLKHSVVGVLPSPIMLLECTSP